jgi:hypothetical protein
MKFSTALNLIQKRERLAREGWNGKNQWVQLADLGIESHAPFIMMKNAQDVFVPWVPSTGDLFAHDWVVVDA